MNILIVSNIYPFQTGGAEIQARLLAEAWTQQGHQITVAGNRIPSVFEYIKKGYFECVNINTIGKSRILHAVSYTFSLSLFFFLEKKKFDVVYCRFVQDSVIVISLLKKFNLLKIPLICCSEGLGEKGDAVILKRLPFSKMIISLINKECDCINIISSVMQKELIDIGIFQRRFSYIANGVNIPELYKKKINRDRKFVFIGRICEEKGVSFLLQAIYLLKKRGVSILLTIVGDGPLIQDVKKLSFSLDLSQQVIFKGKVLQEYINNLLIEYDVFILPSIFEGFGVALIEAMAAGLPVIATRCGGPDDFVDDSVGRIVKAGDADSLAQALQEMIELSDEELQVMGQAARERVKNNFDIDVIADKYIQLFKQHI
uniref:glycosyltransferase family 4 protein n=1 Tax=Candidatus Electronema sp. TaxID=2698783 RepID=UPI004055E665